MCIVREVVGWLVPMAGRACPRAKTGHKVPPTDEKEAVAAAIKRFHARLGKAVYAEGRAHPVLQGFGRHQQEHLLIPSGRSGGQGGARASWSGAGCFTYEAPLGVVWGPEHPTSNVEHPTSNIGQ